MSRIPLVAALAAVAAACLAASAGCRDEAAPAPAPPSPPALDPDALGKRREEVEKATEAQRAQLDKDARGLLASCDARVYRPARDSALERAAGRIDVKAGDKEASYRFTFDVANPADKPVTYETVSEPAGWDPAVATDVRRWGILACVSAYEIVAYYRPPIQLGLLPVAGKKDLIVLAPQFRTPLNVSYSLSPEQLITIRGEWTDEAHKFVTNYDWQDVRGRHVLRGAKIHEGTDTRFDYDDRGDLILLRNIRVRDRAPPVDAQVTFESIHRRPN